ncbi:MAG: 50S ribosomal protein L3 [Candidatus Bipolaricaulaceae bacterium]
MALALLGKKVGMMQWFDGGGRAVAATVVHVEPSTVVQVKHPERDGYGAVQLGHGEVNERRAPKPLLGHFRRAGVSPRRRLYEAKVADPGTFQVGQEIGVEVFSEGQRVDVIGTSKGRGFQGTVKRWGFGYRPKSHGHKLIRRPGTAGPTGFRKVIKGKKMPGHMGGERVTVRNLEVLKVDEERGLLVLRGSVPGPVKGLVRVRSHA